jgi:hypothetical protein
MNVINAGSKYQIYGEEIKAYQKLPVGTYLINFHPMQGFWLSARNDLVITEDKIYGTSPAKVNKVLKSYDASPKNFGVLLSGQKGIGKSLFVRLLAIEAIKRGLPVITVTYAYGGVADFISSIEQDCVIIFDEFEKIFTITEEENKQDSLLSLFDGMDGGHKLFLVTCNDLSRINQHMINRPGRFHYHFTMMPPTSTEVEEYMRDKLNPSYYDSINDIVNLASLVDMPYDYLQAIAFELNQGYSLKEAMSDLNITRTDNMRFDILISLSNGLQYTAYSVRLDLNSRYWEYISARKYDNENSIAPNEICVKIKPSSVHAVNGVFVIDKDIIQPEWEAYDFRASSEEDCEKIAKAWVDANVHVEKIVLKKVVDYGVMRYDV